MNNRIETTETQTSPSTLYLITARGGSKGVPGKNIRRLAGRTLIGHAIAHARGAGADDRDICLSTDSEEIIAAASEEGLEVPFVRPAELATDTASSYDVIMHALSWMENHGRHFDRVVLLQPTSPLRTSDDVKGAMALWSQDIDMVVGVREAKTNPYYNAYEADSDGMLHISKGEGGITRRQDAPKVWEYNGAVYVMTADSLRHGPMSGFRRIRPFEMSEENSVDIDSELDLMLAESLLARR